MTGEVPAPLTAQPELLPGLEVYFEAFALLGDASAVGEPSLGEIEACCEMIGIEQAEERRRMALYLRAMAAVSGEFLAEQARAGHEGEASRRAAKRPRARLRRR